MSTVTSSVVVIGAIAGKGNINLARSLIMSVETFYAHYSSLLLCSFALLSLLASRSLCTLETKYDTSVVLSSRAKHDY